MPFGCGVKNLLSIYREYIQQLDRSKDPKIHRKLLTGLVNWFHRAEENARAGAVVSRQRFVTVPAFGFLEIRGGPPPAAPTVPYPPRA